MRFRLRTLMIVLALGPIVLAWAWLRYDHWNREREAQLEFDAVLRHPDPTLSSEGNPFLRDMQNPPKPIE